jgi:putative oxidoreductase
MTSIDIALLLVRVALGATMIMHGWNHGWGAGGIDGTTRWFAGVGLRPARVHAWASTLLEIAAGVAILLGVLTPLAAAAVIGVMVVAGVVVHRANGFFVFRDGYEYVLFVAVAALAVAIAGPGRLSVDDALGLRLTGLAGGLIAAAGLLGAAVLLAASWRPAPVVASAQDR